jgi:O-antigen ligase
MVGIRSFFVVGLVFLIPYQNWQPFGTPYANLTFLFFFGYVLASLRNWSSNFSTISVKHILWPISLLLVLMLVMTIQNDFSKATNTYSEVRQLFMQLVFFVLLFNDLKRNPQLEIYLLKVFLYGMMLMSFLYLLGTGVSTSNGRTTIFGINANALAFWFALAILIIIRLYMERLVTGVLINVFIAFLPLFIYVTTFTGSRGALGFLFIGSFLYFLLMPTYFNRKLPILVVSFSLVLTVGYVVLQTDVVRSRIEEQQKDATYGGRLPIWEASFELIKRNFVIGSGASGFEKHIKKRLGKVWSPHNEYILVLAYTGIIGLSLLLLFLFRIGKLAFQLISVKKTSFYFVVTVSLLAFFYTSGGFLTSFTLWFIFALIAASNASLPLSTNRFKQRQSRQMHESQMSYSIQ